MCRHPDLDPRSTSAPPIIWRAMHHGIVYDTGGVTLQGDTCSLESAGLAANLWAVFLLSYVGTCCCSKPGRICFELLYSPQCLVSGWDFFPPLDFLALSCSVLLRIASHYFPTNYLWILIHNAFWGDSCELDSHGEKDADRMTAEQTAAEATTGLVPGITADYDICCVTSAEVLCNMQ